MLVGVLPTWMLVHCLKRLEEHVGSFGTGVVDVVGCHVGAGN